MTTKELREEIFDLCRRLARHTTTAVYRDHPTVSFAYNNGRGDSIVIWDDDQIDKLTAQISTDGKPRFTGDLQEIHKTLRHYIWLVSAPANVWDDFLAELENWCPVKKLYGFLTNPLIVDTVRRGTNILVAIAHSGKTDQICGGRFNYNDHTYRNIELTIVDIVRNKQLVRIHLDEPEGKERKNDRLTFVHYPDTDSIGVTYEADRTNEAVLKQVTTILKELWKSCRSYS